MTKPIRRLISSGILLAVTGLFIIAATQYTDFVFSFYPAVSRAVLSFLAGITSLVSVPVWEVAVCALAVWFIASLILALKHGRFLHWLTGVTEVLSAGVCFFVCVWGLNYFAPPMQERLNLPAKQYTTAELREATEYYLSMANKTAPLVTRNREGVMISAEFSDLAKAAGDGYNRLAAQMDCFDESTAQVKQLLASKLFGATGTTGIFVAFTGESSVSSTTFTASMPFTMCHEIGHRMAFARENEANFAAFLACSENDRADFRYSGYYSAFVYCYNALYHNDSASAAEIWAQASAPLKADCAAARAHYEKVRDEKVSEVTDKVYDSYLKAFSVENGRQSYGEVVDLLTAWYFTHLKTGDGPTS